MKPSSFALRRVLCVAVLVAFAHPLAAHAERPNLSGTTETFASADGKFLFHYTRTGVDAVADRDVDRNGVPDYVDDMALGIRRGYEAWVTNGGWPAPPGDDGEGGDDRIDVYIKQITCVEASGISQCGLDGRPPSFLFGITRGESAVPGAPAALTSFIILNPSNDIPLGRNFAQSVAAHELHHVIQFGMDTDEPRWVYEATAAYLQLTLFDFLEESPYIVDVLLLDRLGRPDLGLANTANGRIEYSNALFFRYLVDRFDAPEIVREIWVAAAANPSQNLYSAIDGALRARGSDFVSALVEWGEWNYYLCGRDDGAHYQGGELCSSPNQSVRLDATHNSYPVASRAAVLAPEPMGMTYVELRGDGRGKDLVVDFEGDNTTTWGLRVLRQTLACGTDSSDEVVDAQGKGSVRIVDVHAYRSAVLLVVNTVQRGSRAAPFRYSVRTEGSYTGPAPSDTITQRALDVTPTELVFAAPGEVRSLNAIARFSDCTSQNATRLANAAWRSLDPSVAEVNDSGVVTARGNGETFVLAAYGGQETMRVPVRVGALIPAPRPPSSGGCGVAAQPPCAPVTLLLLLLAIRWGASRRARARAVIHGETAI